MQPGEGSEKLIWENLRPGQIGAVMKNIANAKEGKAMTGDVLPTGYGKRDIIIVTGVELYNLKLTCCNLVLSINDFLRTQFIDKFEEARIRYDLRMFDGPIKVKVLDDVDKAKLVDPASNGEHFLSATIQFLHYWREIVFADWIKSMQDRHGLPVTIHTDECQFNSVGNVWGGVTLKKCVDVGARLISYTATPEREDGVKPFGFETELVKADPIEIRVPRTKSEGGERKVFIDIYGGNREYHRVVPDFEWTYKQAWEESVLCHLSLKTIKVELKEIDSEATNDVMLSSLSVQKTKKVLPIIVRHPLFIRRCCVSTLEWLRYYKTQSPDCAAIIFTGNDTPDSEAEDKVENEHAKAIMKCLIDLGFKGKIVIATSAITKKNDGHDGVDVLKGFALQNDGDILIVKQMAALGLDNSRIKVTCDLSTTRSVRATRQKDMRAARPHKGIYKTIKTCVKIAPQDVITLAIHEKYVEGEGGGCSESAFEVFELELLKSEPAKDGEDREKKRYILDSAIDGDVYDTKGNVTSFIEMIGVQRLIEEFPSLVNEFTIPELSTKARRMFGDSLPPSEATMLVDTGDEAAMLKAEIQVTSKTIIGYEFSQETGRSYSGSQEDQKTWGKISGRLWVIVKQKSEFPNTDYQKVDNLEALRRLRKTWQAMAEKGTA